MDIYGALRNPPNLVLHFHLNSTQPHQLLCILCIQHIEHIHIHSIPTPKQITNHNAPRPPPPPKHNTLHAGLPHPRNPNLPTPRLQKAPKPSIQLTQCQSSSPRPNHNNIHPEPRLHDRPPRPPTIKHTTAIANRAAFAPPAPRTHPAALNIISIRQGNRRLPPDSSRRTDDVPRARADGGVYDSGSPTAGADAEVSYPGSGE